MSIKSTWAISSSISFLISAGIQEVTLHNANFINLLLPASVEGKAADYRTILRKYVVKLPLSAKRSHERGRSHKAESNGDRKLPKNRFYLRSDIQPRPFTFVFFSRPQDRELLGAISRGLLDCPRRV